VCAQLGLPLAAHAVTPISYVWTGIGTGWQGQLSPDFTNGTAKLSIGNSVNNRLHFSGNMDIYSLELTSDSDIYLVPDSPLTLTLENGLTTSSSVTFAHLLLEKGITVNIPTAQTFDIGNGGNLTLYGQLTGSGDLTFTGTNTTSNRPSLLLANLTGSASTYSGTLTIASPTANAAGTTLSLWNNDSLSAATTLAFTNGGRLSVHNTLSPLTNAIQLNAGPLPTGQTNPGNFTIQAQDANLTLSGTITLNNNTTIQVNSSGSHYDYTGTNGVTNFSAPGPLVRHPVILSGTLTESGGARALNVIGDNTLILTGTSNYTGATGIGFLYGTTNSSSNNSKNAGGVLVYGSFAAMPTGSIQSGYYDSSLVTQNNNSGYVGIAASALGTNAGVDDFAAFANRISATSTGSIGIDTLPGESTAIYAGAIDLTHFTTTNGLGFRLGTATSAILTGTITPSWNATTPATRNTYSFGNGGGVLTVRSALTNNPVGGATRNVNLLSSGNALLGLYLQGANTYTGGTTANNGYLVFDGNGALTASLPSSGTLIAGGSSTSIGQGYIGFTDRVESLATPGTAMTATEFLSKFNKGSTWGVIGFDSSNTSSPVTINNLDLTGFNNGTFIGTVSAATLTGTLTPTSVTNGNNPANALRFTAGVSGTLTVQSVLANLNSGATPLQVIVGSPSSELLANGTVVFDPRDGSGNVTSNTYSGGTFVNNLGAITLAAASNNAFGTGSITLQPNGGVVGLSATTGALVIPNNIVFADPASNTTQCYATLQPAGSNSYTLSGSLSGNGGTFLLAGPQESPREVTLAGNNSGFKGTIQIANGTLTLDHNSAGGHGDFQFLTSDANLAFGPNATAPVLYGLEGSGGHVTLPDGVNLTLNTDNGSYDREFGGTITGADNTTSTGSLTIAATSASDDTNIVYLYGSNKYSGGTTITGSSALGLGRSDSAGTGTITISVTDTIGNPSYEGGLALNSGVTLTNPIVFNSGALAGLGNFSPTSINGVAGGNLTIGAHQALYPGIPDNESGVTAKLTLTASTVVFANGGRYEWTLRDPLRSDGYALVYIDGTLDLTSLTAGGFTLSLNSLVTATGAKGDADLTAGQSYSFTILETSGHIAGFNAANFTIDSTNFESNFITNSQFVLTQPTSNTLVLSFTAVPEPSTYALFGLGLALVGFTTLRPRRRS
jgi:hypothetical protein